MRSLSFSMNSGVCGMHFGPSIMTEIWGQELCPDFVIIILLRHGDGNEGDVNPQAKQRVRI